MRHVDGVNQELSYFGSGNLRNDFHGRSGERGKARARRLFGDGGAIETVTLTNKAGLSARVLTYGATLQSLMAPDRNGKFADACSAMTRPRIM